MFILIENIVFAASRVDGVLKMGQHLLLTLLLRAFQDNFLKKFFFNWRMKAMKNLTLDENCVSR